MPRSAHYDRKGQRAKLSDYGRKYPLLTKAAMLDQGSESSAVRQIELQEGAQELAHAICKAAHAADVTGMMLRLNNLLHDALASMEYDAGLPEKEMIEVGLP